MRRLLFILLVLSACKKSNDATVPIKVNDAVTGQPAAGASVSLRRCANLGCVFGLVEEFSGTTDNSGVCHVPQEKYDKVPTWNDAIYVTKSGYWAESFSKLTSVSISPMGWVRLRIIRGASYPQNATLKFSIWNQIQPLHLNSQEFKPAADSVVVLVGFGNQLNKIDWQVSDNSSLIKNGTWNQQVPRLDTVKNITLNY